MAGTPVPGVEGRLAAALWLVPSAPDRRALGAVVDRLARDHGAPPFEPHLTLWAGAVAEIGVLDDALDALAAAGSPVTLAAEATDHEPVRFRTLYVRVDGAPLEPLRARARALLGDDSRPAEIPPHVSLLYADGLAEARRADLARRHRLAGRRLTFDTIAACVPGPAGFDDVAAWDTRRRRRLGGG